MQTFHDQEEPKCTCLDSAYQRQALAAGHKISWNILYAENQVWLQKQLWYNREGDN